MLVANTFSINIVRHTHIVYGIRSKSSIIIDRLATIITILHYAKVPNSHVTKIMIYIVIEVHLDFV